MGVGWRRWSESLRECVCGTENEFTECAINKRTELRMRGAEAVFLMVVKCEQAVRAAYAAHSDLLTITEATMTLPRPNPANDSLGAGSAASALDLVGGPDFEADTIGRVTTESGPKLEAQVLAPLEQWITRHHQLVAGYKQLKNTRLELVSRRRTVTELTSRVSAMSTRASSSASKSDQQLNAMIRTLSRKETKLTATSQSFEQQESVLSRDLAALIVDGQSLKHHVATALRLQGAALLGAAAAFGATSRVPPPAESAFSLKVGVDVAGPQLLPAPTTTAAAAAGAVPQQHPTPVPAAEAALQQNATSMLASEAVIQPAPTAVPAGEAVTQHYATPVPAAEAVTQQYATPVPAAEAVTQQYPTTVPAAEAVKQ
ncbi:hypothetical protein D9Q98_003841 [Chlorella vulgaris]|uniref:Uncharacterized protein n=1 Tax=Chlorella vulgaris TaxID=3077 RepID=A0A9D4YXZ5_CHLVU|nr:hypothetical protein D9Q98_003841 [Chlorella vulgaris]